MVKGAKLTVTGPPGINRVVILSHPHWLDMALSVFAGLEEIFFHFCLKHAHVPYQVTMIPQYVIFRNIHWVESTIYGFEAEENVFC
jgi:hypothetical protein